MVCRVVSAMMRKTGAAGGPELALDAADCMSLQQILQAFNSTISEEHAWALFHQAARCFQKCLSEGATCYAATEPRHVVLHKDGSVHPSTLLHPGDDSSREEVTSEQQVRNANFFVFDAGVQDVNVKKKNKIKTKNIGFGNVILQNAKCILLDIELDA
ncbi:uncharacterized protein LOC114359625 [Ostrinia furnacalis]|uniref:uncharacterized protein LOC114359625 n=1 Tax=Ostrinia furnacalis TaxID=93504 RepID=UPI00103BEF04|nr:uncharacterized protein LOC114359625 [Ostrinia furnacalis]